MAADDFDIQRFAVALQRVLEHVGELVPDRASPWRERAEAHLGGDATGFPAMAEHLSPSELPNLQLALNALLADAPAHDVVGLPSEVRHYGGFSLASLLSGRMAPHFDAHAVSYVNVPVDIDATLPCVDLGVYFLTFEDTPMVVLVAAGIHVGSGFPQLLLEAISPDRAATARLLARLRELRHEHNVYRGKVLAFAFSEGGGFGVQFHRVPALSRDEVILPEDDLAAIERHTVAISRWADQLRAARRHLKRGLLLYGPPGTGKTLSVMYLCNQLRGRTVLLVSGIGAQALGQAVALARSLQPSMVVLEDVDLVAMERTMPGFGSNPLLFQLLNEMDGLAEDADVVFVLTTNRVELLEPALAARPGRIDQAVEIRLPDEDCRRRLFALYLRGVDHDMQAGEPLDRLVRRTAGVSAAFIRELVRRAVLAGFDAGEPTLTATRLDHALTELLERSTPILRSTLGANPAAADGFTAPPGLGMAGGGWTFPIGE